MSASNVSVELSNGKTVLAPEQDNGEPPSVLKVRRGPYRAHLLLYESDGGIRVDLPVYVQDLRPALFSSDKFFNFNNVTGKVFPDESNIKEAI